MQFGEIHEITDGNGGTLNAKIVDFSKTRVTYLVRKGKTGRFRAEEHETSRVKWRKLLADFIQL